METVALRSMKREKYVVARYARSLTPTPMSRRPGDEAEIRPVFKTRRYSALSPPRKETNFAKSIESATEKLNAFYAERAAHGSSQSLQAKGSSGSEKSDLSVQKELLLARKKTFEERTADSVDKYIIKNGVADLMALKGLAPGPATYSGAHDPSKQDYLSRGASQAGRKGFSFGRAMNDKNATRKFQQYAHLRLHGVAYKLMENSSLEPSKLSQGDLLPAPLHDDHTCA